MKKTILTLFLIIWIWTALVYIYNGIENNTPSNSQISIINNNRDLGEIPMDEGKVKIPFEFINSWNENILLWEAETSCMCTEAIISDKDSKEISDTIVMRWHNNTQWVNINRTIKPWEKLYLIAVFDPNAHGPEATWPISRDIYVNTNSKITQRLDFKFLWNVVKTRTEVKKENTNTSQKKEGFDFEEKSFDFWIIKQSWWKVKHDFQFTYNWKEPIKVTWLPTSCACTSATIDKTELNPWDSWIVTVIFNPNLHQEPKWKFFKSVNILTDKKLTEMPEVKIWTEIDLDLWENAFELQSKHGDNE